MSRPSCPLCGASSHPTLVDRPDHEFGVPTRLDYRRCTSCRSVVASPIPTEAISSFYVDYSTHGAPAPQATGFLARRSRNQALKEFTAIAGTNKSAPVLDYGCGDGRFLADLKGMGYSNLTGYDFDPLARVAAAASGATIVDHTEDLEAQGPFATITLNHVVEHLVDPKADLAWLASLLAPGGQIILRTPNARSVLARILGTAWRGWETPRHLHVFTQAGFKAMSRAPELDGLTLRRTTTSQAMFLGIFHESLRAPVWRTRPGKVVRHGVALTLLVLLTAVSKVAPVGEEIVVVYDTAG